MVTIFQDTCSNYCAGIPGLGGGYPERTFDETSIETFKLIEVELDFFIEPVLESVHEADASLQALVAENCNYGVGLGFEELNGTTTGEYNCTIEYGEQSIVFHALPNTWYASFKVLYNGTETIYPRHDNPLIPTPIIFDNITAGVEHEIEIVGIFWEGLCSGVVVCLFVCLFVCFFCFFCFTAFC